MRYIVAILATVAIIGIGLIISNKSPKQIPSAIVSRQLPQNIDVALHKACFSNIRNGVAVWDLVAERAEYDKAGEVALLTGINMEFAKTQNGAIKVTAIRGEYYTASGDVKLRGKVHVETDSGIIFDTESLNFNSAASQFQTSDPVKFRQDRLTLSALGMEMDITNQRAHFYRAIDATMDGVRPQ